MWLLICPWHVIPQALGDLLKATHRGYFIPPRPEKNAVETQRATTEFVDARRAALEHYLQQLALHPVISHSEVLRSAQLGCWQLRPVGQGKSGRKQCCACMKCSC